MKNVDIKFVKDKEGKPCISFTEEKGTTSAKHFTWRIGNDVKEFNVKKTFNNKGAYEISLTITYTKESKLEPNRITLYHVNGVNPGP